MADLSRPVPAPHLVPAAVTTSPPAEAARELVAHVMAELPASAVLDERDRLLATAWLASLRSTRTLDRPSTLQHHVRPLRAAAPCPADVAERITELVGRSRPRDTPTAR